MVPVLAQKFKGILPGESRVHFNVAVGDVDDFLIDDIAQVVIVNKKDAIKLLHLPLMFAICKIIVALFNVLVSGIIVKKNFNKKP